jgi:glycine betaine/proline transport system permease protein
MKEPRNRTSGRIGFLLIALAAAALVAVAVSPGLCQRHGEELFQKIGTRSLIPLEDWIDQGIDWVAVTFMDFFDTIKFLIDEINGALLAFFNFFPVFAVPAGEKAVAVPLLAILIFPYLWWVGSIGTGIFGFVSLWLVANLGLWPETLSTASLTLTAAFIALLLGIPLGILAGKFDAVETMVRPILDFMQTLPVFVYLIPALILFGLGPAPGVVATVIFALPPAVRLTSLGIRGVPKELVEAGEAFGCDNIKLLMKVQLPMARPSIMAGVNQTIMLSLSMVVIAALIGAGGLGGEVVRSIQRMLVGKGFVAGIAVVFLAIILDRATRTLGGRSRKTS